MKALMYLTKRTFCNYAKKAARKPVTYFYVVLIIIYAVFLPFSFNFLLKEFQFNTPEGMAAVVTVVTFWLIPANLISYAKRKGLIFKKGDVHLMFTSPISSKQILLYAHCKTLAMYIIFSVVIAGCGIFLFHVSVWQLVLYFIATMILENILEGSLMVIFYGSERIKEKGRRVAVILAYGIMLLFVLIALLVYIGYGFSLESVLYFLHSSFVQMVPVVGWFIGLMHLILMGPTVVNVVCSVLYLAFTATVFIVALKMKCEGEYYEDAMQFADDYEELRTKRLEGQMGRLGRKEKYGKAKVEYKGGGAKAIFYKQLLEYKKNKYFFFDTTTLIMIGIGLFLAIFNFKDVDIKEFIIPGVMAYVAFCMSATPGKWGKEVKSPYLFMIPDSAFRKLWYATLMEHVKSLVCGALLAIPCGIILRLPVAQIPLSMICYVCLMGCRLYNMVVIEALLGNVLGRTGKQLFMMLLQSLVIGTAILVAAIGTILISVEVGYLLMIIMLVLVSVALMTVAASYFERMETAE